MFRRLAFCLLIAVLVLGALPLTAARAQSDPDAWTVNDLNLRAGAGGTFGVLIVLPPETPLIAEARDEATNWLLVHTLDGGARGWVASGYLRYREGFAAFRLPVSDETMNAPASLPPVSAPQAAPAGDAAGTAATPASGLIESMRLIYSTPNSEYYSITYRSDGLLIRGYLGWPTGPGPFPAVIYNRGGAWDGGKLSGWEIAPFVEAGYVAIASQYRGCGGSQGLEQFGWDDVHDVLNLIPVLDSLPQVDPWRIGMMGHSRGGMMTYMALRADASSGANRIRAAVTTGGIADLFLWAEETKLARDIYRAVIGQMPDQNPDPYIHRSAVYWADQINAPLLLLHGESDGTVWKRQSEKLYAAMQQYGKIVGLIIFPGDDHQLNGNYGGYPEALRFLGSYLSPDADRSFESHADQIVAVVDWFNLNHPG